jgi:hypothetical protein
MTQAPPQFRAVYVAVGGTALESEERLAAVRTVAERFVAEGMPVQVLATTNSVPGWSAEEIHSTRVMFRDTAPPPRLPQATGGGQ